MSTLDGKTAFITGGAGSIGLATAKAFADAGASVFIVDLEPAALDRALAELPDDRAAGAVADVSNPAAVAAAVDSATQRFGELHAVFANAGIFGVAAPITEYPEEVFARLLAVNVLGTFHVAKHAVPHMPRGGSLIINSSVTGLMAEAKIGPYAASKHAVVGLMRALAKELAPAGIRVNTIHPGPVDNSFQHAIEADVLGIGEKEAAATFAGFIPLGRHASPAEIAGVVVFLAGDGAAFIHGTRIVIDGGVTS